MAGIWLDFTLMHYLSFLFIPVYNITRLCRILVLFEFFLVILETPLCLMLLTKTLSARGVSAATHVDTDVNNFWRTVTL